MSHESGMSEQAYSMAQNLDPSGEWTGVLQFRTGMMTYIKRDLARKGCELINREHDIEHLWRFYVKYKSRMEVRPGEMEEIYSTMRVLLDVLEILIGAASSNVNLQILDQVRRIIRSDEPFFFYAKEWTV